MFIDKKNQKTNFFSKFFITYVVILAILFTAFTTLFIYSTDIIESNLMNGQLGMLNQTKYIMDERISKIFYTIGPTVNNTKIGKLLYIPEPYKGTNVIRIMEARDSLYNYRLYDDLIVDYFIAYDDSNVLLGPNMVFRLSSFYPGQLSYEGIDYEQWREEIFRDRLYYYEFLPVRKATFYKSEYDMIECLTSVPNMSGKKAMMVMLLNNDVIEKLLYSPNIENGGSVYIISADGSVLSGVFNGLTAEDMPVSGNSEGMVKTSANSIPMLMSYTTSAVTGWKFVSVIPREVGLSELNRFRKLILTVSTIVIIITILASYFFAGHHTKPIESMAHDNELLRETVREQIPIMQNSIMGKILRGEYYNEEEINKNLNWLQLGITGKQYMVCIMSMPFHFLEMNEKILQQMVRIQLFLENIGFNDLNGKVYTHNMEKDEITLLFIYGNDSAEDFSHFTDRLLNVLEDELKRNELVNVRIGCGDIHTGYGDISKSYNEARQAITYYSVYDTISENDIKGIICKYGDIMRNNESFYFPKVTEQQLFNMVKNGDTEGVKGLLRDLYTENLINRDLSPHMVTNFINSLWLGIVYISEQNVISSEELTQKLNYYFEKFYQINDMERLQCCTKLYNEICEDTRIQKESYVSKNVTEVLKYIEENFSNENISLSFLADRYHMSDAYLSQQIKKHNGENFYNYLQNLRIKYAAILLSSTDTPVNEISQRVGYSSYNAFSKAFRRVMGVNAGEYRKLAQKQDIV